MLTAALRYTRGPAAASAASAASASSAASAFPAAVAALAAHNVPEGSEAGPKLRCARKSAHEEAARAAGVAAGGAAAAAASEECKSDSARGAAAREGLVLAGALGLAECRSTYGAASLAAVAAAAPVGESTTQAVAASASAARDVRVGRVGRSSGARCAVGREHGTRSAPPPRAGGRVGGASRRESPPPREVPAVARYRGCERGGGGCSAAPEEAGEERKPNEPMGGTGACVGGADDMNRGEQGSAGELPNCTGELHLLAGGGREWRCGVRQRRRGVGDRWGWGGGARRGRGEMGRRRAEGTTHCRNGDCGGGVTLVCGGMSDTSVSESPLGVRCALSCAW